MKFKTYVAIVRNNAFQYVTGINSVQAVWENGRPAKAMSQTTATDLVVGLRANGYPAVLVKLPDYECPVNPEPDEYFAETRWCDEDIAGALVNEGYEADPEVIRKIRSTCSRAIHDISCESGWDCIYAAIHDLQDELTPIGEDSDA